MTHEILTAVGVVAVLAALAFAAYRVLGKKRPPTPPGVAAAPAPTIPAYQPAPAPDLLELHYAYGERREREIKLDRYKAALDGIALLTANPAPTPAPPAAPPPSPNP